MPKTTANKPRINFSSVKNPYPYPDFLEVQLKSFRDFLQLDTPPEKRNNEGLFKVKNTTQHAPISIMAVQIRNTVMPTTPVRIQIYTYSESAGIVDISAYLLLAGTEP